MKERRKFSRFKVPGASLVYKTNKFLFPDEEYSERSCPLFDLSKGGIRFLSDKPLRKNTKLSFQVFIPGEKMPLNLTGRVSWFSFRPEFSHRYQIAIEFENYGKGKNLNDPLYLEKISDLEKRYLKKEERIYTRSAFLNL